MLTERQIKERHWKKVYDLAPMIKCACGCGALIKSKDRYARDVKYVNGHNGRKYEDPTQYKREWNHRNRKKRLEWKTIYHRRVKIRLIEYKGGKCQSCGIKYDKTNGAIFQFHHRDPSEKDFSLGNKITRYAYKRVLAEADKCDLVCANCHNLKHHKF